MFTFRYDSIARSMPDAFSGLLERIRQLELELGHLPQKWRVRWDQLELPNTLELQVSAASGYFCEGIRRINSSVCLRRPDE